MTGSGSSQPTPVPTGVSGVLPLSLISSGMSSGTPSPVTVTYAPGAMLPIPGAPVLPAKFVFNSADWPAQDKVHNTTSDEVQTWMQELNGFDIPSWMPTADGTCAGDPAAAAEASEHGWWTCGWTTRGMDITTCPKKLDWGVSASALMMARAAGLRNLSTTWARKIFWRPSSSFAHHSETSMTA
jgi:hypothetical protein